MLELKVYDGSEEYYLELYVNDPVNLKYQFTDIEEIQKASGSYSQSFRVPATDKNVQLFGTFFQSNTVEGFNPKRKKQAELYYNTIPILTGFIQLKSAYIQKENYADFEIVFFGESVNLARTLGDKKLKDLDLSAYDHTVNYANAVLSWAGSLFSGDVRYGLLDKYNWSNNGNGVAITEASPIYAGQMTLFLRVEALLDKIAEDNGFTFESNWKATLDNYYVPMINGAQVILGQDGYSSESFYAGITANQSTFVSGLTEYLVPSMDDSTAPFFDNGGNFASNIYSPSNTQELEYEVRAIVRNDSGNAVAGTARVGIQNITDGVNIVVSDAVQIPVGQTLVVQTSGSVVLEASKEYRLIVILEASSGSWTIFDDLFGAYYTGFRVTNLIPYVGYNASLQSNAPDIKQIDFLTSLQKMFNLVFVPDKLDPKKIKIEPFDDFVTGGSIKDWTDYLDYSKDVVIEPTTDIQSKNYEWTYSKDKDFSEQGLPRECQEGVWKVFDRRWRERLCNW